MINLSDKQNAVVMHKGSHARVVAVAGAGKTTTLVQYVMELMANGQDPRLVRVVMFNKAAQLDFTAKLQHANDGVFNRLPEVRTFHSMGLKLYKNLMQQGLVPEVDLKPVSESRLALQTFFALKAHAPAEVAGELDTKKQQWIAAATSFIDRVKSDMYPPAEVFKDLKLKKKSLFLLKVYDEIEAWLHNEKLMTYADMLYRPAMYYKNNPDAASRVTNLIDHILVDEYQDVNGIQNYLVKLLAGTRAKVMVIGDSDQNIYSWRGSRSDFMLKEFNTDFPGAIRYPMNHTWRYGHELAIAANNLIWNNQDRDELCCVSGDESLRTKVSLKHDSDSVNSIIKLMQGEISSGRKGSDIAILCRVWSQTTELELALLSQGMPYRMDGGYSALSRSEIQSLITVLEFACSAIYQRPAAERREKIVALLRGCSLKLKIDVITDIAIAIGDGSNACDQLLQTLSGWQAMKAKEVIKALRATTVEMSASKALSVFIKKLDFLDKLQEAGFTEEDGGESVAIAQAFIGYVKKLPDQGIENVLRSIHDLISAKNQGSRTKQDQQITITSMHRSKGLEWPVVILPGLSDKCMPYQVKKGDELSAQDIESERRLLYVATTRTKEHLVMYAPEVNPNGVYSESDVDPDKVPSRFLSEMDLPIANVVSKAIATGTEGTFELPYPADNSLMTYLDTLGSPINLRNGPMLSKHNCDNALVVHTELGPGKVVGTTELFYVVAFHDRTARILRLAGNAFLKVVDDRQFQELVKCIPGNHNLMDNETPCSPAAMAVGDAFKHENFGKGKIMSNRGGFFTVDFGPKGIKRFPQEEWSTASG